MPTEMMEKVARAIAQADERNGGPPYEMRVKNKHSREMLFDEAQAAIEALRKPTDAMLQAFYAVPPPEGGVWDAVIDAALERKDD